MSARSRIIQFALAVLFGLSRAACARPVQSGTPRDQEAEIRSLYARQQWEAILRKIPRSAKGPADLKYYRGMALAHLGRWAEARATLEAGWKQSSRDERFPVALAEVAYRQNDFAGARRCLRRALKLKPGDRYAVEFLASLYFLQDNLDAALEEWNRIGEPRIRWIETDPPARTDPELLDRAFAIAPASTLKLGDLRTTRARLDNLGVFPRYRFDLVPAADAQAANRYDLRFSPIERNGWGQGKLEALLATLGGLPYETLNPRYANFRRRAINFSSLVRWDDAKRRLLLRVSAPLHDDPAWRYTLFADGRDEHWNLSDTFHAAGPPLSDLQFRRIELGATVRRVVNGRLAWSTGIVVARRTFGHFSASAFASNPAFTDCESIEGRAGTRAVLLDDPARRFRLESGVSARFGRNFGSGRFARGLAMLKANWSPKAEGDDWETSEEIRAGAVSQNVPLDELFMLGLDRDNDLPLRAHIGTKDGMKGNAPLGDRFLLSNWEIDKNVYSNGWVQLRLAPFLDSGHITDGSGPFGEKEWLWDTGAELKVRVLGGVQAVLTYGKDLRTGRNTFYATIVRH